LTEANLTFIEDVFGCKLTPTPAGVTDLQNKHRHKEKPKAEFT